MSIRALSGFSPVWFTPDGQDDDPVQTRFKLRPLDGEQYSEVADHMDLVGGRVKISAQGARICLAHGLVDWEHFKTDDGEEVKFFQPDFKLIDWLTRVKLTAKIIAMSELKTEEKKT